jgi:phage terminase large subunit-like protein
MTRGERVCEFVTRYLTVPEGGHVGKPVVLRPWQREIILGVYDGAPPCRRAVISFGRKNGKTALAAMLLLAHLVGPEARTNGQIYSAAQSRDQAAIVFSLAAKMVRMSATLNGMVTVRDSAKELFCEATGVRYKALSADATTAYGFSPVLVIHDELGQVRGPRSELYDALETAMGAQDEPLSIIISTQAVEDADLLSVLIDDAQAGHDPRTRLFLYAADPDADVSDETAWQAANPALGDFNSLEQMREAAARAARMPSFEPAFRNLNLNQRVAAEAHFLAPSVWKACAEDPDDDAFAVGPVYGGLDLSGTQDLTALVLVARDAAGVVHARPWFWTPGRTLRDRAARDRAPYDVWRDQGLLEATPGTAIDYGFVAQKLADLAAALPLVEIRFDRWNMPRLRSELDRIGCSLPLVPHGQGFRDMSPALDALETLALDGRLRHGGHPIMTWCASNAVAVRDQAGNRKLDKSRGTGRIDGLQALAMAVSGITTAPSGEGQSFWEVEPA